MRRRRGSSPSFRQLFLAGDGLDGMALERRVYLARKRMEHELGPAHRSQRGVLPEPVGPHVRVQGHAHHAAAARVLPGPGRRTGRIGAHARALALLDQHVPVVAAGPSVPLRRPQRRDQHRAGQPQLDAGTRGIARERVAPGRPRTHLPDLQPGRERLGHLRRGARAVAHGRLRAAARRA